jgi:hypothetical protein
MKQCTMNMYQTEPRSSRPLGIAGSTLLLHALNVGTVIFIRWGEPDSVVLAALIALYICFTAIVIHAYWKGLPWARWLILIRSVLMLASFKVVALEGGFQRVEGVAERVLAIFLLLYLNSSGVRAWFAANGPPST